MTVAERLREKARGYELNALAANDRGEPDSRVGFSAIAAALFEVAEALDVEEIE